MSEALKQKYIFGMDFGTRDFKFGPISLGEMPEMLENRGYFPDRRSIMSKIAGVEADVIVGKEIPFYLEAREDLSSRLIYPMKNGIIEKDDERAWIVVKELSRYALNRFRPADADFRGFHLVASLSSVTPRYMYERFLNAFREIGEADGTISAVTIIPQPLCVAIAHKILTCVVLESGHGNTQVAPISRYPIRNAIVALNRGGGDGNNITSEILRDTGYGDLAHEESLVRRIKETIGLVPLDLSRSIQAAKNEPERFRARCKIEGTRIEVDLSESSWMRFLIGEYVFDPNNEIFGSYFARGMPKPSDVKIGDINFRGMLDLGEAIVESVERTPVELQPHLYRQILLSGGNFSWRTPDGVQDSATDAATKLKMLMQRQKISDVSVITTDSPQFSVWRGAIVYGYAVPQDYEWSWERMEGWMRFHA